LRKNTILVAHPFLLTPCPGKNRIRCRVEPSTAKWKGDSTCQGKHVAPHIAAKQGRSSMPLEMPKAVSKIFRPMSERIGRTWPEALEQRRPARGPRGPKVNCQLVVGQEIVDFGGDFFVASKVNVLPGNR
jgi:hypothetical protein